MQQLDEVQAQSQSAETRQEQTLAKILRQTSYAALDWRLLMQEGLLIRLTIRRCGFTSKLSLADLGVTVKDEEVRRAHARLFGLGEKRLLPEVYMSKLSKIDGRARRLLAKSAFYTELGYFMPASTYDRWREETEGYRKIYEGLRDEIIAKHDQLVEEMLKDYRTVAADTYARLMEAQPESFTEGKDAFIARYCAQIEALIPSVERIKETFDFKFELIDAVEQMDAMTKEPTRREAIQPSSLRAQSTVRAEQREALFRDFRTQAQAKKDGMVTAFLTSIVASLRTLTYNAVSDVLASIERRNDGKFPPKSVTQLQNLIAQISQLNFYADQDIERIMAQIQEIIEQPTARRNRSIAEIQGKLRGIAMVTRATLMDLDQMPRKARKAEFSSDLSDQNLRRARQELGLDLPEVDFERRNGRQAASAETLWTWPTEARGRRIS